VFAVFYIKNCYFSQKERGGEGERGEGERRGERRGERGEERGEKDLLCLHKFQKIP
jgi:hypothetical protein